TLQAEDVIHIGPVGPEVALLGSINKPAIFELKGSETVEDVLAMAGGFTSVADRHRLSVEHLDARNEERILQITLPADAGQKPRNGDVVRAFSAVEAILPLDKQNKRVLVEGEVLKPGEYVLPPNSTLNDAIKAAGGLTGKAYVFGTELDRESVRLQQDKSYDRALQDMETQLALTASGSRTSTADEAAGQQAKTQSITSLIERLRKIRPTGRVVLELPTTTSTLPDLSVENADRITIPARPNTVSVFGSVYNTGSYLYANQTSVGEILKLAGGPTKGADAKSIFVLRANGSVISARQNYSGWLMSGDSISQATALPGDTIYVPEEMNKTLWIQDVKDWTQILANFGLSVAAFKTLGL
ncbi:MAG: SLBB domain-containing protein, partial [Paucibacter sp.]|nr:SLBB domain-containing protein [Roseateles sp.]